MKVIVKLLARRHIRQLIILLAADSALFGLSNAKNVPSVMLMVGFVLLLATIYQLMYGLLAAIGMYGLRFRRQQRLALSLTGLVGMVVALQTIGELSPRDVVVLLPLAVIAYLYSSYGRQAV